MKVTEARRVLATSLKASGERRADSFVEAQVEEAA
jgi:hypothetical protein